MREPTTVLAFVLIDGIGDVSIPELGNRTPLEAAHCPNLDAIAGVPSRMLRAVVPLACAV